MKYKIESSVTTRMKNGIILLLVFATSHSFAQKADSTTSVHLTGSYSNGLCGLLQKDRSQNAFYNKFYTMASVGIRKDFFKEKAFGELLFNYYDRGTRYAVAAGNSFLPPDDPFNYHNHYLSLQVSFGFYFKRNFYLKEAISFDYLVDSDQYNVRTMHTFRGLYRFTPAFETSVGFDFPFLARINGYVEWFAGITFLKPVYIYSGPRIGFYFKEKEIMPGYF